ncbi:MAG: YihY/virulence factor BrkB family protein [Myxococcota bacterium]|nr:YihY/virulence factor BrkB family protein [Myxococcota bacterium]
MSTEKQPNATGPVAVLISIWRVLGSIREDELTGRAAQIAFYMLFAIFPALLVVISTLGLLDLGAEVSRLEGILQAALPPAVADPLLGEVRRVTGGSVGGRLFLGLALALYLAFRAVGTTLRGVHAAWGVRDPRPWYQVSFRIVVMTLGCVLGVVFMVLALSAGEMVRHWLILHGNLSEKAGAWVGLFRWPLVLLTLHQLVHLLYRSAATARRGHRFFSRGSISASLGWVLVTLGFQVYLGRVIDLGATYGSLGTVIGLAMYLHACALVVLLGAKLDAEATGRQGVSLG